MKTKQILSVAALAAILATATTADAASMGTEKCYGVARAGNNDCKTAAHSCAGHGAHDGDASDWVKVPTGLCKKLANGSKSSGAMGGMGDKMGGSDNMMAPKATDNMDR
jgi:uncharacterized membrane protein